MFAKMCIPYKPCVDEEDEIIVVHSENIDIDVGLKVYKQINNRNNLYAVVWSADCGTVYTI